MLEPNMGGGGRGAGFTPLSPAGSPGRHLPRQESTILDDDPPSTRGSTLAPVSQNGSFTAPLIPQRDSVATTEGNDSYHARIQETFLWAPLELTAEELTSSRKDPTDAAVAEALRGCSYIQRLAVRTLLFAVIGHGEVRDMVDGYLCPPPYRAPDLDVVTRDEAVAAAHTLPLVMRQVLVVMPVNIGLQRPDGYDARLRAASRRLCDFLSVPFDLVERHETTLMAGLVSQDAMLEQQKRQQRDVNIKRGLVIGGVALAGGALCAVTGGLLAPVIVPAFAGLAGVVTAGIGAVGSAVAGIGVVGAVLGTVIGVVGEVAGVALLVTPLLTAPVLCVVFGTTGAGLAAYKVARRTRSVEHFRIRRFNDRWDDADGQVEAAGPHPDGNTPQSAAEKAMASIVGVSAAQAGVVVPFSARATAYSNVVSRCSVRRLCVAAVDNLMGAVLTGGTDPAVQVDLVLQRSFVETGTMRFKCPPSLQPYQSAVFACHNLPKLPTGAGVVTVWRVIVRERATGMCKPLLSDDLWIYTAVTFTGTPVASAWAYPHSLIDAYNQRLSAAGGDGVADSSDEAMAQAASLMAFADDAAALSDAGSFVSGSTFGGETALGAAVAVKRAVREMVKRSTPDPKDWHVGPLIVAARLSPCLAISVKLTSDDAAVKAATANLTAVTYPAAARVQQAHELDKNLRVFMRRVVIVVENALGSASPNGGASDDDGDNVLHLERFNVIDGMPSLQAPPFLDLPPGRCALLAATNVPLLEVVPHPKGAMACVTLRRKATAAQPAPSANGDRTKAPAADDDDEHFDPSALDDEADSAALVSDGPAPRPDVVTLVAEVNVLDRLCCAVKFGGLVNEDVETLLCPTPDDKGIEPPPLVLRSPDGRLNVEVTAAPKSHAIFFRVFDAEREAELKLARRLHVAVAVGGFLTVADHARPMNDQCMAMWRRPLQHSHIGRGAEVHVVDWEPQEQLTFGSMIGYDNEGSVASAHRHVLGSAAQSAAQAGVQQLVKVAAVNAGLTVSSVIAIPYWMVWASDAIDNTYAVMRNRAEDAGLELAHALTEVNGRRPTTLVGFSFGANVIVHCLLELYRRGASHLVDCAYLLGVTIDLSQTQWHQMRAVVGGRLVNIFSRSDMLLSFVHRANTLTSIRPVAGLSHVSVRGVENIDATATVHCHLDYGLKLDQVLGLVPQFPNAATLCAEDEPAPGATVRMSDWQDVVGPIVTAVRGTVSRVVNRSSSGAVAVLCNSTAVRVDKTREVVMRYDGGGVFGGSWDFKPPALVLPQQAVAFAAKAGCTDQAIAAHARYAVVTGGPDAPRTVSYVTLLLHVPPRRGDLIAAALFSDHPFEAAELGPHKLTEIIRAQPPLVDWASGRFHLVRISGGGVDVAETLTAAAAAAAMQFSPESSPRDLDGAESMASTPRDRTLPPPVPNVPDLPPEAVAFKLCSGHDRDEALHPALDDEDTLFVDTASGMAVAPALEMVDDAAIERHIVLRQAAAAAFLQRRRIDFGSAVVLRLMNPAKGRTMMLAGDVYCGAELVLGIFPRELPPGTCCVVVVALCPTRPTGDTPRFSALFSDAGQYTAAVTITDRSSGLCVRSTLVDGTELSRYEIAPCRETRVTTAPAVLTLVTTSGLSQ